MHPIRMAHDVFISHSTADKAIADAMCATLEAAALRCWVAPRDVQPGRPFAGEITRAIQNSAVMVLIFSAHSNNSDQVLREVQLAVNAHLHIVQFRIEDVLLNDDLSYYLSTPHWLDALTPPLENHLDRLTTAIRALLAPPISESRPKGGEVTRRFESSDRIDPGHSPENPVEPDFVRPPFKAAHARRKTVLTVALAILLVVGVLTGWWWYGARLSREEAEPRRQLPPPNGLKDLDLMLAAANKRQPFVNSLGMKFVPVPGTSVLFSIWETRVRDFEAFIEESGRDMKKGEAAYTLEPDGNGAWEWKQAGGDWRDPHFPSVKQRQDQPVVCVSWNDAVAFGEWLTEHEHRTGFLPAEWTYRLPGDHEWSCAVGIGAQENPSQSARAKNGQIKDVYPWGTSWPPPRGAGNFCGEESRIGATSSKSWSVIEGYRDGAARTSPVGQYEANQYGIYDLGGNVWEWCEDTVRASRRLARPEGGRMGRRS